MSYEIAPVEHAHHQVLVRLAYRQPVAGVDQVETGLGIAIEKLRHRQRRVETIRHRHEGHVREGRGLLDGRPRYVPSTAEADYEPNLTNFAQQKCDFILAVGGLMGAATDKVAGQNPNSQFAIVDYKSAAPNDVFTIDPAAIRKLLDKPASLQK